MGVLESIKSKHKEKLQTGRSRLFIRHFPHHLQYLVPRLIYLPLLLAFLIKFTPRMDTVNMLLYALLIFASYQLNDLSELLASATLVPA